MKTNLEKVLKFLVYASFFVPLIVIPSSFIFPFIVPKILTFRSIVEVMLGCYVLLLIINWEEYRPKFTAINLVVGLFILSFALSTFIGTDAYHSFWDNHERMLGLFTILHFGIYYLICTSIFRTWNDWKWAMRVFLFAGSIVMFIGLLQTQNPELLLNQGSSRVASTLGNPIYVGGYGLFLTFLTFLLFVREKDVIWRWVYGAFGTLAILGLFFSGTRGDILALVAGIGAAIVGYIIVLKDHPKVRWALVGLAGLVVVVISLLYAFKTTSFVTNLPAVGRAVNTSFADIKNSPRWIAWEIAIESWKERPIFGWGPNNYFYAFNAHYNPRSLNYGYGETWFDNAHNIIMNTLAVQGIVGILTYLAIFAISIVMLYKVWRKYGLNYHVAVVTMAFLVAHLVGNITVFENPTSYLYFMFWLAFANAITVMALSPVVVENKKHNNFNKPPVLEVKDKNVSGGLMVVMGALVFLLILIFNIQPARANMMTLDAIRYLSQDPILSIPAMKEALSFNSPHIDDIRSDIGRTAAQLLAGSYQKLGKDKSKEIFDVVYPELRKNLILHPLDIRNQISIAQLDQLGYSLTGNGQYILDAEAVTQDALEKSPRRQQVIYSLSGIKMQMNKTAEAIRLLEKAIVENNQIAESYWRLAYSYRLVGNDVKALEVLDSATRNGVVFTDQDKATINQIMSMSMSTTTPATSTKKK